MCATPLFFFARSHVVYWFLFCVSRVLSHVYPVFVWEVAWPSGQSVGFEIRRTQIQHVQIPFWPPAVVLGNPEFNFSAASINSQMVCLPPVGICKIIMCIWIFISIIVLIGPEKPKWGVANYVTFTFTHLHLLTCTCESRSYCTVYTPVLHQHYKLLYLACPVDKNQ